MKRLQSIRAIFNRVPTQLIMTTDNDFFLFKKKNSKLWEIGSGMLQEKYIGISLPYYASDKIYV